MGNSRLRSSTVLEDSAPATEGPPMSEATDVAMSALVRRTQGPNSAGSHPILPPVPTTDYSLARPMPAHYCTPEMSEPEALLIEETAAWSKSPSRPSGASGLSPVCNIFIINI